MQQPKLSYLFLIPNAEDAQPGEMLTAIIASQRRRLASLCTQAAL